jgi:chemotaxis protein histidine kinase CheA
MSFREQLHAYIAQLEQRLRWSAWLRGWAIFTGSALVATLILVTIANALAFSHGSVTAARFALVLVLAIAAAAGLALPLRRLTRRRAIGTAEAAFPQFQQRLTTFAERDGQDPFIELLAGDALDVARSAQPSQMVTGRRLWISLGAGAGAFAVLVWMIAAGPGFLGYGASLLWTGPHPGKPALYDLRVAPGDAVVRRHADQLVSALPTGLRSPSVKLYARFQSSSRWEEIAMQPQAAGSFAGGYQFLFAGLPENVEYYVTAGAMTSPHFNIRVTDLPAVKQIRVTYHYPAWTGMPSEVEERGGDLRAVTGTQAELEVSTDRPLQGGQIQLDNGQQVQLTGGQNNVYRGTVKMDKDGVYHVAGVEAGQPVRVSEDFFIEARKANPPQITLVRPGRGDYHASPIEEVTVAAKATGEYGLSGVALHYSVNGGPETTVDLLQKKGEKQADGSTTLSLEAFKAVPGDLVSVYATARDANAEAHTDMMFIQADPFEREYSQSQQSGGGGGGGGGGQGNQSAQISQREKEIIAATFKQQGDKNSTQQQATDIARLLSQSQATLHDQAVSLSGRLQARELTEEVQAIGEFQKDMIAASDAMAPAAQQLQHEKWKDAIPNEQKALQFLLRAEATFRQIQVAFGSRGGGGGGGGGGAARDLAALFDLELDTEKNQYETRQPPATTAEQRAQEIDDALKKLDELAKREDELAQQQRSTPQTAEQRWEQEMLRREAQQLQQQMERQLAQNGPQGQQSRQGQQGQQSQQSQQSGQAGQRGGPADGSSGNSQQSADQAADSRQQAAQQALDRLRQASDDMKRAASQNASAADSRRAADRLREATDLLGGMQQQDAASRLNSMAQTADQLAARQKQQADHVRDLMARQNAARAAGQPQTYPSAQEIDKMVNDRQQVTDDLAHLTQQIRTAARELTPTQPAASTRLRSALDGMDENDLGTRMQRSSDWLRGGQFSDPAEAGLTSDLQKLGRQVADAARALGNAQRASGDAALNRAMDNLSRLRDQLAGLGGRPNAQPGQGQPGRAGQPGRQQGQPGQSGRQQAQNGQPGQQGQPGRQGGQQGQGGQGQGGQPGGQRGGGRQQSGQGGGRQSGPMGNPAGGAGNRDSTVYGNLDTGNTRISGQAVAPQQGPNPADTQRQIDQGLNLLNQVRAAVQDSPEARQQLQALIDQMRNLDPSRFPGNPALVEQMHQQLVSSVDALELQLRRQLDENRGGTIRNADPAKVPAGYRDSVAEYYRKLSGGGH